MNSLDTKNMFHHNFVLYYFRNSILHQYFLNGYNVEKELAEFWVPTREKL